MYNERVKLKSRSLPAHFSRKADFGGTAYVPMHYHNEIELLRIKRGSFSCVINGEELSLKDGDVLFINSRVPHSTAPEFAAYDMVQIDVDALIFGESAVSLVNRIILSDGVPYCILERCEAAYVSDICEGVFGEFGTEEPGSLSILLGSVHMLVGLLVRAGVITNTDDIKKTKQLEKISAAIMYMSKNCAENITTPQLAALCGLHTGYFCEVFKAATGKSCIEFLNCLRVRCAEKLINTTEKSIIEIALEVGFASPSYFDRVFKRINGNSPSYYRRLRFGEMAETK